MDDAVFVLVASTVHPVVTSMSSPQTCSPLVNTVASRYLVTMLPNRCDYQQRAALQLSRRALLHLFTDVITVSILLLVLQSCASVPRHRGPQSGQEQSFGELWKTYSHCQTMEEPHALLADAIKLNQAAQRLLQPDPPALLKPFTSPLPVRLAADPTVMAQACALKAAQAAAAIGWNDVAVVLYRSVIPDQLFDIADNFYSMQARTGLADVLARSPEASIPRFRLLADLLVPRGDAGQPNGSGLVPGAIPPAHLTDSIPGGGPGFGLTKPN
jgi:hypothetical protein